MKFSLRVLCCVVAIVSVLAVELHAKSQRMGIPSGTSVKVAAQGSKRVGAYCLNASRSAPTSSTSLNHVLTGRGAAVVRIGNGPNSKEFDLADAINQGLIEAKGDGFSSVEFVSRVPGADLTITFHKAVALSEQPESMRDIPDLDRLLKESEAQDDPQLYIWTTESDRRSDLVRLLDESGLKAEDLVAGEWSRELLAIDRSGDSFSAVFRDRRDIVEIRRVGDTDRTAEWQPRRNEDGTLTQLTKRVVAADTGNESEHPVLNGASREGRHFVEILPILDETVESTQVRLGDIAVEVSAQDLLRFVSDGGEPPVALRSVIDSLAPEDELVLWRNPLLTRNSEVLLASPVRPTGLVDASSMALRLREFYGSSRAVFLDDDPEVAHRNLDALPRIGAESRLDLLAHRPSLRQIGREDLIRDMEDELGGSRIRIVESIDQIESDGILIVNGHKTEALKRYVARLLMADRLDGRILVMLSCGADGDPDFNSWLVQSHMGPRAVLFFQTEVAPDAVQSLVLELAQVLAEADEAADLYDLFDLAIEQAERNAFEAGHPQWFIDEIKNLKRAVLQISMTIQTMSSAA